jgi:hypothetical protein
VARGTKLSAVGIGVLSLLCLSGTSPASAETGSDDGPAVSYYSFFEGWGHEFYPLDPVPRFVEPPERVRCEPDAMVRHHSRELRYTVRAHPAFVQRLERFETFVIDLATEHYGRAPRRLVHKGSFACRSARARRIRISEHAFGNALDFQGLDFPALRRGGEPPAEMPRHMRRGFSVRVLSHWSPRRERDAYHAAFLHRLAEELRARPDIFRGIVGPPRPRHRDHLHLDAAPWRYAMFGYDPST